jgi:hypothetical protein
MLGQLPEVSMCRNKKSHAFSVILALWACAASGQALADDVRMPAFAAPTERELAVNSVMGEIRPPVKNWPMPGKDDEVILLSTLSGGRNLADLAVSGPNREVTIFDVHIEPGSRPIYLLATSAQSVVWNFSGATSRISKAVIAPMFRDAGDPEEGKYPDVAVTGIDPVKIDFSDRDTPLKSFSEIGRPDESYISIGRKLQTLIRKRIDVAFMSHVTSVSLPSGEHQTNDRGDYPALVIPERGETPAARTYGAYEEIVRIDPAFVTTPAKVRNFEQLPGVAGLMKLEQAGVIAWEHGKLRVLRPLARWPDPEAMYVVSKGLEVPSGRLLGCAFVEATGATVGQNCPPVADGRPATAR